MMEELQKKNVDVAPTAGGGGGGEGNLTKIFVDTEGGKKCKHNASVCSTRSTYPTSRGGGVFFTLNPEIQSWFNPFFFFSWSTVSFCVRVGGRGTEADASEF